jgi:uncharacterized protein (TIRG00374 family)
MAAGLLWLFLRNAEWRVLIDGLRSVGWLLLAGAIVARLASLVVSSVRWQVLLTPVRRVPLGPVVTAMMMGMAVSALVSMQAAEIARPYLLSKRVDLSFSATVATVAVEWLLDLLSVLTLFIPARGLVTGGASVGRSDVSIAVVLLVAVSVASLVALRWVPRGLGEMRGWIDHSAMVPQRLRGKTAENVEQFVVGLRILESPKGLATVASCSLLASFLVAVSAWLALLAFGLSVSFLSGFVILGLITIGGLIPTPGAVGGFHAVCQLGLVAWLGVDPAQTVAPVIGLHAVLYAPGAAIGALCFFWTRSESQRKPA